MTKWQGTNETVIINSVGADVLDSPRQMAKNGQNGRLIASPTNTIYSITVGEDIMSRETWFTNCEGTWFTTYTTNKFEAKA